MPLSARVLPVEDFFRLGIFIPASVQRDYVWDCDQAEDLFNDIERACSRQADETEEPGQNYISVLGEDAAEEPGETGPPFPPWKPEREEILGYHLGEVVLRRLEPGRYEIFDGLQRATTLTILLSIIRDLTASSILRGRIRGVLQAGAQYRITLPGADRTLADEIQAEGASTTSFRRAASDRGMRIRRSRNVFYGYLKTWNSARLAAFGTYLLERTYLVVAETASQALARQVFITSNDRGIVLRPIDIFKGQICDICGSDAAAQALAARWDGILQMAGDGVEEFMRAFDFILRRDLQGPDHLTKLADHAEKNYGAGRIGELFHEIAQYASAWQELKAKLKPSAAPVPQPDIWRLGFFRWFEWKPLALAWLKEYRDNKGKKAGGAGSKTAQTFQRRFAGLHRACMIITLAKFSAVDRAKIFGKALSQWRQGRDPFSTKGQQPGALTFPPHQLARALETLCTPLHDDEVRLGLLRWLESVLNGPDPTCDAAFASVEHVLPIRPAPGSQWLVDFPGEEERFAACHSIGNLALMDYAENLKIANLDFRLKLPAIKEQSKKYKSLCGIAEKTCWNAAEIRERAGKVIAFACQELNIPRPARS
jgi:hypothetical protein